MDAGAAEDTEVDDMCLAVVVDVVTKEDAVEGAMVITRMNFPVCTKHAW